MTPKKSPAEPTAASTDNSLRAGRTVPDSSDPLPTGQSLYRRAEKICRQRAGSAQPDLAALSPDEAAHLLHDLHVHQIELELQNEELRRLQSELDASREHYFDLYDLAPVGYCTLNQIGQIMEANLTTATLLQVDREALIRQPLGRFVLQEDQEIYRSHLQNLFATGEFQSFELRMRREDDAVFWLSLNANLAADSKTVPVCRLMLSDISRLKKAEEALQKNSEERFRKLLEEAESVAVQGYGADLVTHYWNHASELLYGYPAREAIGRNLLDLIIPTEMRAEVREAVRHMTETKRPIPAAELSLLHKDGSQVTVFSSHAIVQTPGRPPELYCIDIDLSGRKLMEESLRESENRYRQLFESASDALFLIAPDSCQIIKANIKASELYGYNQEELLTKKCMDLSTEPDETFHLFQTMQPFPAQPARVPLRLHRKKDGTIFPVEITAREFPFNGRPLVLAVIRDISERVEAEKEKIRLEAMNWQLQKRESLKRMAGAIAHNFNNRLGVVIGNLEMMIDDLPRQTRPRCILTAALEAAQKAAEIGGLLLTYLGQSTGRFAPLDLSEICRSNLPLLQAAVPKTIAKSFDLPVPGPVVNGNSHQLQQVINNLVTNACEASLDKKGTVNLTIRTLPTVIPTEHFYPTDWQPNDAAYACIEVKDTGCGIEEEDLNKLFDPFFSNKFTGRGMGLPVVLGIVKAHDGAVSVETEVGKGSIFRVFLPVFNAEKKTERQAAAEMVPQGGGGTVLLVDDEDAVREMAEAMLSRLGFTVLAVGNGREAVDIFRRHKDEIQCVLCDLTMPEMDGYETFSTLREIAPEVRVILSSGYSKEQIADHFADRGFRGFLHKPYSQAELLAAIRQALEQSE